MDSVNGIVGYVAIPAQLMYLQNTYLQNNINLAMVQNILQAGANPIDGIVVAWSWRRKTPVALQSFSWIPLEILCLQILYPGEVYAEQALDEIFAAEDSDNSDSVSESEQRFAW